ncbi:MAG TPA: hypothetical protein VGL23_15235, partial [Chloroflexota bacterium]
YEAMTSARPHRAALGRAEAVAELRRGSGTQFSPRVVEAFVRATEAAVEVVPATESTLLRLLAPQVRSVA